MREVTLAAVQIERTNDKQKNLENALAFVKTAVSRGAQAVCLPEAWLSHSPERSRIKEEFQSFLVEDGDEYLTRLSECAKKHKIYLVAGAIYERDHGVIYNSAPIFEPNGNLLAKVRKANLESAPVKDEIYHDVVVGPPDYNVFDTEVGKIGVIIDVDIIALEVARIMGLKGCEIIFWPLSWPIDAHDTIANYGIAAALMCEGFVVQANPFGEGKYFELDRYNGGSGIIDLRSYIARVRDYQEGVAVATVDLDRIKTRLDKLRDIYPYYRRPESYSLLLDKDAERSLRGGNPKWEHLPHYNKGSKG